MSNLSRRNFCKKSLSILVAAPVVATLSDNAFAQAAPTKALDPANPTAVALGYYEDATKVDTAKWPKKAQPGAAQSCSNCMLLTKAGLKADGKSGEWGTCGLFPQALVPVNGWCNSWVAKPA